jgi:single-strand DNA-binding protein
MHMLDTYITVVGNLVADPRLIETDGRPPMASFRVASTPRRYDRAAGEWRDGETLFTSVTCWRGLAENVALSLKKGQSVIVHGRLMKRGYETKSGEHRESVDIDALAVGPDLSRAAAVVKRVERSSSSAPLGSAPLDSAAVGGSAPEAVDVADLAETADVAETAETVEPQPGSDEFDAALPAVGLPEADGEMDGELDGEIDDRGEEPELAGAGAGGRRRPRFGIG